MIVSQIYLMTILCVALIFLVCVVYSILKESLKPKERKGITDEQMEYFKKHNVNDEYD